MTQTHIAIAGVALLIYLGLTIGHWAPVVARLLGV